MSDTITRRKGTIDKYIGDNIMAFWGAPIANPLHASDACAAALECQNHLKNLHIRWKAENKPLLTARMGINTGKVIVGNMGSEKKMDYSVLGDAVNVASRLESLNKYYGTGILIGQETCALAKNDIIVRKVDTVSVYGKDAYLDVFELLAMKDDEKFSGGFDWTEVFEEGISLYRSREWEKALSFF